ncbi:MAG: bacteriocin [Lachnospiraceae bacterium]|nr:bacteriocin [Lachnospiraceae bacterium]MCR5466158.1 bacteriocin [Lachnospiraceae bacterium]
MFKTLNKNEMMNVNGGFKYIPVYNRVYYKVYRNGTLISTYYGPKTRVGTQQVANNDPRTEIVNYTTKILNV